MPSGTGEKPKSLGFGWNIIRNFRLLQEQLQTITTQQESLLARMNGLERSQAQLLRLSQTSLAAQDSISEFHRKLEAAVHEIETLSSALPERIQTVLEDKTLALSGRLSSITDDLSQHTTTFGSLQSSLTITLEKLENGQDAGSRILEDLSQVASQAATLNTTAKVALEKLENGREADSKILEGLSQVARQVTTLNESVEVAREKLENGQESDSKFLEELSLTADQVAKLNTTAKAFIPMNSQYFHALADIREDMDRVNRLVTELHKLSLLHFKDGISGNVTGE